MLTIRTLGNGLVVIIEEIPHVQSAAYELLIPGGVVSDQPGFEGTSLLLAEMTSRGAGKLSSRALSEAFDNLGVAHSESASQDSFGYRGSLLASKLGGAIELLSMMVQSPTLPPEELDSVRSLFLQDIAALADNPMRRVMVELVARYFPGVWGRSSLGTEVGLKAVNPATLRNMHAQCFRPKGAVLSIAGKVEADKVMTLVERHLGAWKGEGVVLPKVDKPLPHTAHHINFDSAQVQIALAYPSAAFGQPHYYAAKVATSVLSGGMFGRLFIEVREKRGLCYSVRARHSANQHVGTLMAYAGTTPERAHETFEVLVKELRALKGTVTDEELERSKVDIKSGRIIGEESTGARASLNAGDWWFGRRVRPLAEVLDNINAVSADAIDRYLETFPADSFASVTLGPREVVVPR